MDMTRALGRVATRTAGCVLATATLLLAGCSSTSLTKYCCYDGEAALVHLEQVAFVASDGSSSTFLDVYPGYTRQDSFATTPFPFRKVGYSLVTYDALAVILPLYDANKNGFL
jgi:hypothetical protein